MDRIRLYRRASMLQVMELLDWDELQYTAFMFGEGLRYLRLTLRDDASVRQMQTTMEYWGWWKLHWHIRETDWLAECERARSWVLVCLPNGKLTMKWVSKSFVGYLPGHLALRETYQALQSANRLAENEGMERSYSKDLIAQINKRNGENFGTATNVAEEA